MSDKKILTKVVPPNMRDNYDMRIKKATSKDSNSGNPMIECEVEVANPVYFEDGDTRYDLSSLDLRLYLSLGDAPWKGPDNNGNTTSRQKTNKALEILGFKPLAVGEKPSEEMLAELNKNFCFAMILTPVERIVKKKGSDGKYSPIIDRRTNKPITQGWELNLDSNDILYRVDPIEKTNPY